MTEYSLIIAIILSIAVAVVAYRVIHGVLRLMVLVVAVASIVLGIAAFLVVMDANSLRENLGSGKNLVVVVDNDTAVFAMELRGGNGSRAINAQEIDEYSKSIKAGDYGSVKGSYYKLIILSTAILGENGTAAKPDYKNEPDDFFIPVVENAFSDPVFFVSEYRKGNIIVYEETALFKAVKLVPAPLIRTAADRAIARTRTVVVDKIEG